MYKGESNVCIFAKLIFKGLPHWICLVLYTPVHNAVGEFDAICGLFLRSSINDVF